MGPGMRWVLVLCALGTTAIIHAARSDTAAGIRAVSRSDSPPAAHPRNRDVSRHATQEGSPTQPAEPPKLERPPPSMEMLGKSSVVRGVIVDETGAPVPTGKIRGMQWQWRPTCGARSYGVRGYARKGEFVFRYRREITPPFPGPIRAGEGRPDLELSFWVEAPGFAHEEFVAQREISAAVDRGDCVDGLTIVLQRSASVEGTVFGPDGKPRAGIDVGVADHPLAFCSEYRTRRETDEQGRFRLDDVDPRRRLWLHVRNKELLGRPLPLGNLSADAVTHRTIYVERIHEVDVRFEIDATEGAARIRIDFGPTHFMKEGEFRVLLDSGPHLFEFKDARGEVVKRIRLWIEPQPREQHKLVRLDGGG